MRTDHAFSWRLRQALLASASGLCALALGPAAAAQDTSEETASDELVVTALRRGTDIQGTPETMSVVRGEELTTYGRADVSDLANIAPGMAFSEANAHMQVFIRGVGHTLLQPGGDPGVALYSDGVYVADVSAASVAFLDVERIEILRGPQGALYGRNAVGGAINVVSASPTNDFSASLRATVGDFGRAEFDGFASGPIGDTGALARFSFQSRSNDGFMRNLIAGTPGAPDRVNQNDNIAVRLQSLWPVGDGGELRLIANYAVEDSVGPTSKILPESFAQPAELLFGLKPTADPDAVESNYALFERDVWSLTGRYQARLGGADLIIVADTRENDTTFGYDLDGTPAPVFLLANDFLRSDQWSVEAYLAGGTGTRFEWLLGATYLNIHQDGDVVVPGLYPLGFLTGNPADLSTPFPATIDVGGTVDTTSWAIYADGRFALNDWVRVRTGIRFSDDEKDANEFVSFAGFAAAGPKAGEWSEWTGRLGLEATPSESLLLYANIARGYKSGAINLGAFQPPVDPELVTNYELGFRYTSPHHRLLVNGAVFQADYTDMQVVQVGAVNSILTNSAASTITGAELEVIAALTDHLRFSGSVAYLDAAFDEFLTADLRLGGVAVNAAGHPLPLASEWQIGVRGEYVHPLSSGAELQFNADYAWRSEFNFSEFIDPLRAQDAYGIFDIAAAWQSPNARWRVFAFGNNITDETAIQSMNIVSPLLGSARVADYIAPRTYGIGVQLNY